METLCLRGVWADRGWADLQLLGGGPFSQDHPQQCHPRNRTALGDGSALPYAVQGGRHGP